ncbi:MAG TPA: DNA-binding response regulator [Dyadobacter sp.]|nr:DNA-binding response regulator [Dyadobacter sp.]
MLSTILLFLNFFITILSSVEFGKSNYKKLESENICNANEIDTVILRSHTAIPSIKKIDRFLPYYNIKGDEDFDRIKFYKKQLESYKIPVLKHINFITGCYIYLKNIIVFDNFRGRYTSERYDILTLNIIYLKSTSQPVNSANIFGSIVPGSSSSCFDVAQRWFSFCFTILHLLKIGRFRFSTGDLLLAGYNVNSPAIRGFSVFAIGTSSFYTFDPQRIKNNEVDDGNSALKNLLVRIYSTFAISIVLLGGIFRSSQTKLHQQWSRFSAWLIQLLFEAISIVQGFLAHLSEKQTSEFGEKTAFQLDLDTIRGAKETILLIGDSLEISLIQTMILQANYEVLHSDSCPDGYLKSVEMMPDVIVCDISSINEQGYELCRKIKDTASTTHIPVILIAQRGENFDDLAGLKMGADSFLIKPISVQYLLLQIFNLLNLSRNNRYTSVPSVSSGESSSKYDERERARLEEIVESNLTDIEFRIPKFARLAGMSQMSLYNYIKELTGGTVNEFIKDIRLRKAAELLRTGRSNVTETASLVGFEDRKYFSREFKKRFGMSPKEYSRTK